MEEKEKLNINRKVDDVAYRYKMPRLTSAIQGAGGGIKTRLTNLADVAKALHVPPDYPLTFIGMELGTQIEFKENEQVYLLNGKNEDSVLLDKLYKFIDKYVLCPLCKLPEIYIQIKNKEIRSKCNACGKKCKLDATHKFSKYILKKPPSKVEDDDQAKEKSDKVDEKDSKKTTDTNIKNKILQTMEKTKEIINLNKNEVDLQAESLEKYFAENSVEGDLKYYSIIQSLFDQNIFKYFKSRSPLLKKIIEKDQKKDEAPFHILTAIIDLLTKRFAKETFYPTLTTHTSSVLYVLYEDDFFSEDWYFRFMKGNNKNVSNMFHDRAAYDKFNKNAEDFNKWIENAPYEEEEKTTKEAEEKVEKKEKKQKIDLDNI